MGGPDLVATLIPIDPKRLAETAFLLPHNEILRQAPAEGIAECSAISNLVHPPTPGAGRNDSDYSLTPRIRLSFEKLKDPTRGFVFGTNPRACDVLLGYRGTEGISDIHFCISFNEQGQVLLRDSSTWGMAVTYDGQGIKEVRHHFTWILNLYKNEKWNIEVHIPRKGRLAFKVELASQYACTKSCKENLKGLLDDRQSGLPPFHLLGMDSHATTAQPSQPLTPRQYPIYVGGEELRRGPYGEVDKVIDVSTGGIYARKRFYEPVWPELQRKTLRDRWLERICKEIRVMRSHPHVRNFGLLDQVLGLTA